jgi:hypothetical protein
LCLWSAQIQEEEEEEKTYLDGSAMSVAGSTMASELARGLG